MTDIPYTPDAAPAPSSSGSNPAQIAKAAQILERLRAEIGRAVVGLILVLAILWLPDGIVPAIKVWVKRRRPARTGRRPLVSGLLYRLPENGVEMRQDELQLPGWPVQQLRLQVDPRGASLVGADLLIILSGIPGLMTKSDGSGDLIPSVRKIDDSVRALAGGAGSERNVGGMVTKLLAAEIAAEGGVDTIIASGRREGVLLELAAGKKLGTRFSLKKK